MLLPDNNTRPISLLLDELQAREPVQKGRRRELVLIRSAKLPLDTKEEMLLQLPLLSVTVIVLMMVWKF